MKHLYKIAEANDIPIIDMKMNGKEEAISHTFDNFCIIAIDPHKVKSAADLKVKSAHELGHCLTGSFYNADCPVVPRGRCERRATVWAVKNTVSLRRLRAAMRDGATEVWELAEHFGVTEEFMVEVLKYYNMWNGG